MYQSLENQLTLLEEPVNFFPGNKKVLLIDNDIASYYLIKELLSDYGIGVIHAECGFSAIQLFIENAFVDAVITEIKVPRLDGFGILREFKSMNPEIPVIVQTANIYAKQNCLNAGFDAYIEKPINIEDFKIEIMNIINFG